MLTKEEYIAIGDRYSGNAVTQQLGYHTLLLERDGERLVPYGFSQERHQSLLAASGQHATLLQQYNAAHGQKVGGRRDLAIDERDAKHWRLRAQAIGGNSLTESADRAEFDHITAAPGRGKPALLGKQLGEIMALARKHEKAFRDNGADDAFFAEGDRLAAALATAGAQGGTLGRKGLVAEHDVIDELEGRIWELLKQANRSGRALHLASGDRVLASEYNLDLLSHRSGSRTRPQSIPAPAAATPAQ